MFVYFIHMVGLSLYLVPFDINGTNCTLNVRLIIMAPNAYSIQNLKLQCEIIMVIVGFMKFRDTAILKA